MLLLFCEYCCELPLVKLLVRFLVSLLVLVFVDSLKMIYGSDSVCLAVRLDTLIHHRSHFD